MQIDLPTLADLKTYLDIVNAKLDQLSIAVSKIGVTPAPAPAPVVIAKIGTVGYATLQLAADAALDGQTIFIQPGVWTGAMATAAFPKNCIVEGVKGSDGKYPELKLDASVRPAWGKAILVPTKATFLCRNLTLTGCDVPDDNGAGLRPEPTITDLQVENVTFQFNEDGVLGPDSATAVYKFTNCLFDRNGDADVDRGHSHNIYVNVIKRVELTNCTFKGSLYGHEVKSRALETVLTGCTITCGSEGRAIDYPNGGVLLVKNCTLIKPDFANNGMLVGIGHEGISGRTESYRFEGCVLTNLRAVGSRVMIENKSTVTCEVVSCTLNGSTTMSGLVRVS